MPPKVFISYSWTSQSHQELVTSWAERLIAEGVEVVMDIYDLKEGNDTIAFMEKMESDPTITHVLAFSDKAYTEKANARRKGVGTESQIISAEVYAALEQTKYIPIVCEFENRDTPYLPTFLKSRKWIDFSGSEAVNRNWEGLIRLLYGKPLHQKPEIGKAPAYILEETNSPSNPAKAKFANFSQAVHQGKPGLRHYRNNFLDACSEFADKLRVREAPEPKGLEARIVKDCTTLISIRDLITDWVLLESQAAPSKDFDESLLEFLDQLLELRSRPREVSSWNDSWFEAHRIFAFETFLYIIAALIKAKAYEVLRSVFTHHYLIPATEGNGTDRFCTFERLHQTSETLVLIAPPEGRYFNSQTAELVKRQATRTDIPFNDLIQAELLALAMACINPSVYIYPKLMHYAWYDIRFPLFVKAEHDKGFQNLAKVTGIGDANVFREAMEAGFKRLDLGRSSIRFGLNFSGAMNLKRLNTLKS